MNKALLILATLACASSASAAIAVPVADSGNTAFLGLGALCAILAVRKFIKK